MHTQPEGVRYSPSDFAHTTTSMGSGGTMPGQTFHHTNEPQDFSLSGPQALRSFFFPRQTVQIQEAARILGIGRERNYDPVVIRKEVQYKNKSDGQTDFVDIGPKIRFLNRSDEAVLAGLQLCQQRFGKNLTLYGSEDFKKQAIKIAVANRITIANTELQEEIFKLEGQRLRRDRLIDRFSKLNETDETKKQRKTVNGPGF